MPLSQEERDKFETDFKYLVDKYIQFFSHYNDLLTKTSRTEEEEEELQAIQQLLLSIGEVLSAAMQALGDELFGKAINTYYQYKDAALSGDKNAISTLNDLKPLFKASLSSRISQN